jgi:cytoskeletal protein CcmA (bactofilin family)
MNRLRHPVGLRSSLAARSGGMEAKVMKENSWDSESRLEKQSGTGSSATSMEHATIGPSIVIKGEVSGTEPFFVDGCVEGSINFPGHQVTIGPTSRIHAEIHAYDVVVAGSVEGNIYCTDLLDIRAGCTIQGHLIAQRIRIDDGAFLKGSVEVHASNRRPEEDVQMDPISGAAIDLTRGAESMDPAEAFKTTLREAAAAVSVAGGVVRRGRGSPTLLEPTAEASGIG